MGASKQLKLIIEIEHNIVKNPTWSGANQFSGFSQDCRGFELGGFQETNPGGGQSSTRTRDRWIASLRRWPLGHAASS